MTSETVKGAHQAIATNTPTGIWGAEPSAAPARTITVQARMSSVPDIEAMEMIAQIFEVLKIGPYGQQRIASFFGERAATEIELAEAEQEGDEEDGE